MFIFTIFVAALTGTNVSFYRRLDEYVGSGCIKSKDDSYLDLTYAGPTISVSGVKLVHTSGKISCQAKYDSYWGCKPTDAKIGIVIHFIDNHIFVPRRSMIDRDGFYLLSGQHSMSSQISLRAPFEFKAFNIAEGYKIRVWYGEDLYRPDLEYDNRGETCFEMYLQ